MNNIQAQLLELTALTQRFLLQEYGIKDWIFSDPETYHFFRQLAANNKVAPLPEQPKMPPKPSLLNAKEEKAPVPNPAPSEKQSFKLEPIGKAQPLDLTEMRKAISEKFPKIQLIDTIPQKEMRLASVIILAPKEGILKNVGEAISNHITAVTFLDPANIDSSTWKQLATANHLRLIVCDEESLHTQPALHKLFHPAQGSVLPIVGKTPALVVSDSAALANDPQRKRELWNNLKTLLQ